MKNLFLCLSLFLIPCLTIAQEKSKIPKWFTDQMAKMTEDNGFWLTDNARYVSENEPYESYGIYWKYGIGKTNVVGRMVAYKDGKEVGPFWEFRSYYDPVRKQVIATQYGWGGMVGTGTSKMTEDGVEVMDQLFTAPDGNSFRSGHKSHYNEDGGHVTESFDIDEEDNWTQKRSYTWVNADPPAQQATVIYFIRHAETVNRNDKDKPLSKKGHKRADKWKALFVDENITAIYSTEYARTMATAKPTAEAIGCEIAAYTPLEFPLKDVLSKHKGQRILVVGHSNTTPELVNKLLGREEYKQIDHDDYNNLYTVIINNDEAISTMLSVE